MIRGEIGLLKEVIEAVVHTIEVDSITISTVYSTVNTCNTLYLNTGTELTIAGTKYRITEFVINESFTLKAVRGTTTLDISITEITIPNPRFYDGTPRRAQAEALNDQKVPGYQTPIIWALTWVEIKGPEDKRTSYIRSTIEGLNLFFLDFCKHEDWNQQDHRTEVWEPMENEMWHIFKALELRTDIFSRDIQEPDRRFHSNFGTYLTNKGYDNTILTGAWSGVQAILDIPYIIDPCDCETVVVCRPARFLIEGVTEETILAGGDLNITIANQDGDPIDYDYDADTNILEVQTTSGGSVDIYVNGVIFYSGVSTDQYLLVKNTELTNVGSKIGANWIIGDSPATFNGVPVTSIPSEQGKDVAVYDSAFNNVGTVIADSTTVLDIAIADATQTMNGVAITAQLPETAKTFVIRYANNDPVVVTEITDTATSFIGEVPNIGLQKLFGLTGQDISYATYDDGWRLANGEFANPILSDYYTLVDANEWGHYKRYTGDAGGYMDEATGNFFLVDGTASNFAGAFPNSIIRDYGTRKRWYANRSGTRTWTDAVSMAQSDTVGGESNWRLPTSREYESLSSDSSLTPTFIDSRLFNWSVFNMWSSTTYKQSTTSAFRYTSSSDTHTNQLKTQLNGGAYVKDF